MIDFITDKGHLIKGDLKPNNGSLLVENIVSEEPITAINSVRFTLKKAIYVFQIQNTNTKLNCMSLRKEGFLKSTTENMEKEAELDLEAELL